MSVEAETKEQLTYACDLRTMPLGLMSDIYTYPRPNSSAKRQRLNPYVPQRRSISSVAPAPNRNAWHFPSTSCSQ